MNLPNKLTVTRILLVPFFVAALLIDFPLNNLAALAVFGAASLTDLFDGRIARKQGLVTDFGKFADPLADKILVFSALLCFVQLGLCDCVAVIIVLMREFAVTSIRLIAASKGNAGYAACARRRRFGRSSALLSRLHFPHCRRSADLDLDLLRHSFRRYLYQTKQAIHFRLLTKE